MVNPAGQRLFGEMWGGVPGFFVYPNEEDSYIEFDITDPNNVKLAQNPAMLNVGINFGADGVLPACLYIIEDEEAADGSYAAPITYVDGNPVVEDRSLTATVSISKVPITISSARF